ncbi:MAG: hypothetical protein ACKVQA_25105 [Burkholderiales bacterium]
MNANGEPILKANPSHPGPSRFARLAEVIRPQHWLGLMLLGLHAALVFGIETWVAKGFLLFHFGSFLLWQPVIRGQQKLYWGQAVLVIGAAGLLVAAQSLWLMALWIALLLALIGGQVPSLKGRTEGLVALLAATYLLFILLVWVVPNLMSSPEIPDLLRKIVRYAPLVPIGVIFFVRAGRVDERSAASAVDLLYSLLLFFLVIVLVLGAFVIRQINNTHYVFALAQALLVIAALLVALSWMWDPRAGFTGLGHLLSRYFLSVGTPFERWMQRLADIAQQEREPEKFLALAAQEIVTLPWISGIEWSTAHHKGSAGHVAKFSTDCSTGDLKLNVYTRWFAGPSLVVHMRLLTRLLVDYYEAKTREQEQRNNAYMRAIYETGTRLTHDVKNLLQSLKSLCSAVESSQDQEAEAVRSLTQRQLPQITQRLQSTLDKLTQKQTGPSEWKGAREWWVQFSQRHAQKGLHFLEDELPEKAMLPAELFDSVGENLIHNALAKRQLNRDLAVTVHLEWENGPALNVADNGNPVPETVARKLFMGPVASSAGLGVGLYQAAKQASSLGFRLSLVQNTASSVHFALRPIGESVTEAGPRRPFGA